jgi:hypothetical protein
MPNGVTVTLVRRSVSGQDEFGNDVYTETTEDVQPCSIQQGSSRENLSFTDQVITGVIVFIPYGTDLTYLDAIIYNGVKFEVAGDPDVWVSPWSGNTAPIRVYANVVKGAAP